MTKTYFGTGGRLITSTDGEVVHLTTSVSKSPGRAMTTTIWGRRALIAVLLQIIKELREEEADGHSHD
jgi:hypothetical protein